MRPRYDNTLKLTAVAMRALAAALFCSLFLGTGVVTALAQGFEVGGRVTSATDGAPLPGVNIVEAGTQTGTTTDIDGEFTLTVSGPNAVLNASFVGFETQTIPVNGRDRINIVMQEAVVIGREVVVTAFGVERQERALGYSVSTVGGEALREVRETNVANALAGKVAGVVVTKPATGPAGSSRVVIRGNTSLEGNNQPLYVVDGIPIDNTLGFDRDGMRAGMWGGVDRGDGIQAINPDDIENVSVLKGPAAAALYGTRAQNGVILITTRRGGARAGRPLDVEFNSNTVFESPLVGYSDYQTEYGQGTRGAKPASREDALATGTSSWGARLDGSSVVQFDGVARPYSLVENKLAQFYDVGATSTNTLSLSGGLQNTQFRFSGSYLSNVGTVQNSGMDRYTLSLRGTSRVGRLTADARANYVRQSVSNRTRLSDAPGNPNFTIGVLPTNVDPRSLAPGHLADNEFRELEFDGNVFSTNPYWAADRFIASDENDRIMGFALMRFDLTDWLSVQGRVGQDWYKNRLTEVTPYGTAYSLLGGMSERDVSVAERNFDFLFQADRRLAPDIGVNATFGGNRMDQNFEEISLSGQRFNSPAPVTITNLESWSGDYGFSSKRINSLYGSAELSYADYLFLTATARNDWSSTLPEENNSYFYPSISASFVFSDAFTVPNALTYGKLRGSWAQVGGDTNPYQLRPSYAFTAAHNDVPLAFIAQNFIPLAELKPSTSEGIEAGLELRLMDDRLGFDFTWYTQTTTDQILRTTIPSTSGFGQKVINAGEMKNQGVELLLNLVPVRTSDFRWGVDFNFGLNRNKVVELTEGLDRLNLDEARSQNAFIVAEVGEPFSTIRGRTYVRDTNGNIVLDGDGFPLQGPVEVLGVGIPDWRGGLTNSFRYKNLTLSTLVDISWGGELYSGTNRNAYSTGLHQNTLAGRAECEQHGYGDVDNPTPCWVAPGVVDPPRDPVTNEITGPGTPNTTMVFPQTYWGAVATRIAEEFVYDATYIKLRELQLTYRLPGSLIARSPIQMATVSLVGRNLWLIHSKVPNVDPESTYNNSNAQGLEWAGVPQSRSIGFNVNLRL